MVEDPTAPVGRAVAEALLEIGAVVLRPQEPFTWASGLRAPIYCDNRLTISYPRVRRLICDGFAEILRREGSAPEAVVGTATAGIPHAAWLAERLDAPMAYVRAKPKEHGKAALLEGRLEPGAQVVVVEDLVSTGGSSIAAVEATEAAGVEVRAVLAIFTYGLPSATAAFARRGLPLHTLTTYDEVAAAARARGALSADDLEMLAAWQADPQTWSAERG